MSISSSCSPVLTRRSAGSTKKRLMEKVHDVTRGKLCINYVFSCERWQTISSENSSLDLSLTEVRSLNIAYFFFFAFSIQRVSLRRNASSFEIYSDKIPLVPGNDILKLFRTSKMSDKSASLARNSLLSRSV